MRGVFSFLFIESSRPSRLVDSHKGWFTSFRGQDQRLDDRLVQTCATALSDSSRIIVVRFIAERRHPNAPLLSEGIVRAAGIIAELYWCVRKGGRPARHVKKLEQELGSNFVRVEMKRVRRTHLALGYGNLKKESGMRATLGLPIRLNPLRAAFQHRFDLRTSKRAQDASDLDHELDLSR